MYGDQQPQQGDCLTLVSEWWKNIPFGTKSTFVITIIIYLMDLLAGSLVSAIFVNVPYYVFFGQVQRLIITHYCHAGMFINVLFSLLSISYTSIVLEKQIGSVIYILDLFAKNFCIQVFYIFICILLFPLFGVGIFAIPSFGLWNIVMSYIAIRSFSAPEENTQFLCFPVMIKNKYYPLAIILLINLFAFPRLDMIAATVLGYLEYKFFSGMMVRPSKTFVKKLEDSCLFRKFKTREDFVGSEQGVQQFFATPINDPQPSQQQAQGQGQQFRQFAGKGVQLGSGGNNSAVVPAPEEPQTNQQRGQYVQLIENNDREEQETQSQNSNQKQKPVKNYNQFAEENT